MPKKHSRRNKAPKPQEAPQPPRDRQRNVWIYLLLVASVFVGYARVLSAGFINYDDPDYVTKNPHVQAGLTWAGTALAFRSSFAGNWFPLTWLSHMLDYELFGMNAGWHHFTSVCIHALSALLLFAVLLAMTGRRWPRALVAFLFALHPLHVESVAWISERKDTLSALFWMLTLWSYSRYAAKPAGGRYALAL